MKRRTAWAVCIALTLVLLGLGPATAAQTATTVHDLTGDLVLSEAILQGRTAGVADEVTGVHVSGQDSRSGGMAGVPRGSFEVDTGDAVVNWSYLRVREGGYNPLNPEHSLVAVVMERSSGETAHGRASLSISYASEDTALLILPGNGAGRPESEAVAEAGSMTVAPADGSAWSAGRADYSTDSTNPEREPFLTHDFTPTPGHPVLSTTSALEWTAQGDFVLYVWGANVTVDPADGEAETYRSGRWRTDVVGDEVHPHGVTAEQHSQFLRIYLTNATFTWTHEAGPAHQVAERFELETDGTVRFEAARGLLESADAVWSVEDEAFEVAGRIAQSLGPQGGGGDALASRVRAEDARISLAPSDRLAPAGGPVVPTGALTEPGVLVPLVLVAAAVAGAAWTVHRSRRNDGVPLPGGREPTPLERSELALVDGDPRRARRLARQVLDRNPNDLDAWLLVGACLIKERAYERAVEELVPAAERLGEDPGLAYVLTLAHAHLDDAPGVLRWGAVAGEVPALRHQLHLDPAVEPFLDRLARDWASAEEDEVGVAYA